MERHNVSTGTDFEEAFGYSRAVRKGSSVRVAGTAAFEDGEVVAPGDAYEQSVHVLETIEDALEDADAAMSDVVLTRIYVRDFALWEDIGRAHREYLGDVRPATTMIEVADLPDEDVLLEIEAEAVVG
jgi:enamine deaminase RidA (YjgF/YER057c/UK114 family)